MGQDKLLQEIKTKNVWLFSEPAGRQEVGNPIQDSGDALFSPQLAQNVLLSASESKVVPLDGEILFYSNPAFLCDSVCNRTTSGALNSKPASPRPPKLNNLLPILINLLLFLESLHQLLDADLVLN